MINKALHHSQLKADIDQLNKTIDSIVQLFHLITPDILPFSEKAESVFKELEGVEAYSNADLSISKNDLMFKFWLYNRGGVDSALSGYYQSGITNVEIVKKLLADFFDNMNDVKLLDFACGHGRATRFYKSFLPIEHITVSDIKENAVAFQKKTFGYNGFTATADPLKLNCDKKFDFIIVSSLFTHLNKDLFAKWIKVLGSLLNENGILSISLHLLQVNDREEFQYVEKSEEDLFPETSDNLRRKNIYGVTHINKVSFFKILDSNLGFKYKVVDEQPWNNSQVLISIKKSTVKI